LPVAPSGVGALPVRMTYIVRNSRKLMATIFRKILPLAHFNPDLPYYLEVGCNPPESGSVPLIAFHTFEQNTLYLSVGIST